MEQFEIWLLAIVVVYVVGNLLLNHARLSHLDDSMGSVVSYLWEINNKARMIYGKLDEEEHSQITVGSDQPLFEGVKTVNLDSLTYVELLAKEAELNELKLKMKELTDDAKA